ncbi:MAG: ATP-binding protein [Sulfolobaceae archaeon]
MAVVISIDNSLLTTILQLLFFIMPFLMFILTYLLFTRRVNILSRREARNKSFVFQNYIDWNDIYDSKEIKQRLEEIAREVEKGKAYGVILFGPPGTGKTVMAKALASKLKWSYFELKPSRILSKWYGESELLLETFLDEVEKSAPSILLIDEFDSFAMSREGEIHEVTHRLVNILLNRLQEFHDKKVKVLVIATTNLPQEIDEAFLRPGRFDEIIYVPLPDRNSREEIWRGYIKRDDIDYKKLSESSERFSPADIKNVVEYVNSRVKNPTTQDFLKAITEYKPSVSISTLIRFENLARKYSRYKIGIKIFGIPEVKWEDLGDLEEIKRIIRESVELPLLNKELAKMLNIKPVKGILLYGPPGVGKTSIAKAIANELRATFIEISGEELSRAGPIKAVEIIAEKFYIAIDNSPSVIFIDEIDMIARFREINEWRNVLTELLRQMDGLREVEDVIVIGSTNRPWDIDPALLRAGRFDKIVYVPPPNEEARKKILKVLLKDLQVDEETIEKVAKRTEGFVPADLKLLVDEIKRNLLKEAIESGKIRTSISYSDFEAILEKIKPSVDKQILEEYIKFGIQRK